MMHVKLASGVCAALAIALITLAVLNAYMVVPPTLSQGARGYADFEIFYVAAGMLRGGLSDLLYDYRAQTAAHHYLLPDSPRKFPLPFNHLAYEATLFIPLSMLPFQLGFYLWDSINIAMLIVVALALRRALRFLPVWLVLLAQFAFYPNIATLGQGQDSILLALVCTVSYLAMKAQKDEVAGAVLALGLFKYHLILPLVFLLFSNRQWRAIRGFVPASALVVGGSIGLCGISGSLRYLVLMGQTRSASFMDPSSMPNLRGLLTVLLPLGTLLDIVAICLSMALLLTIVLVKLPGQRDERFDLWFALALTVSYLISFHAYVHDMSPIVIALLLAANYLFRDRGARMSRALETGCAMLMLLPGYVLMLRTQHLNLIALPILGFAAALWFALHPIPKQEPARTSKNQLAPRPRWP